MARKTAGQGGDSWDKKGELHGHYYQQKSDVGVHNSKVYMILDMETDKPVQVWGSTVLDTKFQEIPLGSEVWIECLGETTGKRGSKYVDYTVDYDDDNLEENLKGVSEMLNAGLTPDEEEEAKKTFK